MGNVCVICERCQSHEVTMRRGCTTHSRQISSDTSVDDVLHKPLTSQLTPVEQKLQTSLARPVASSNENRREGKTTHISILYTYIYIISEYSIHTWSQPMTFVRVSQARVPSGKADPEKVTLSSKCSLCWWWHYLVGTWKSTPAVKMRGGSSQRKSKGLKATSTYQLSNQLHWKWTSISHGAGCE